MEIFGIEIKLREVILSIAIVLILGAIGFGLHGCIEESVSKNAEIYNRAFKPTSEEQFAYGAKTSIGPTLMTGTLVANEPVQTEYTDGEYMALDIVKEHYTMHVEVYTTTDSDGNVTTHTRVYWTWDEVWGTRQRTASETFSFCGVHGKVSDLACSYTHIATTYESSDDRWVVRGVPKEFEATIFVNAVDNKILPIDRIINVYRNTSVTEVVERQNSRTIVKVFDVFWVIFIVIAIILFIYAENHWLDGGKTINLKLPQRKRKSG